MVRGPTHATKSTVSTLAQPPTDSEMVSENPNPRCKHTEATEAYILPSQILWEFLFTAVRVKVRAVDLETVESMDMMGRMRKTVRSMSSKSRLAVECGAS
jgi:hypothetical protein